MGFADGVVSHYVGPKGPKVALPTYLEYNNSGFIEYLTPLDDITYTVPTSQRCINFLVGNRKCPEYQYSIAEHSATFKEYQMKLLDSRQLTDDRNFLKKGVELLKLENENRFEVRFKDGSVYPLKIDRFSPRRGVFFNSPTDFFITKTTFDNIPLAERMKFHGTESIFGPLTLKFFEEIGYSTRSKQQKLVLKPSESGMQLLKQLGPLIDKFDDSYFI